jgi:rRNA processing protein Krr1/Pno1
MVRELQSRSQAKIQVDHTAKAFKPDTRLVSIVGTPEAVVKAEEMVMFLVANPLMDAMKAIRMLVDDKMQRGGRWGSGPPYPNMPNRGLNMGPVEPGSNQPPPSQQYSVYQQTGSHYPVGQPLRHPYGAPPPQQAYGAYVERGPETEFFPAAKMYMGRIIGQKGVTINDVQKRSGCDIQINQDVPPGQDCLVTIKGSRQGIEMAKQMLREIIEMGPNHPYAGGGGRKYVVLQYVANVSSN